MKKAIVYLLIVAFLFQSCISYKTIDLKQTILKEGKVYKIRQEDKFVKGKLKTVNDSTLTVVIKKNEKQIDIKNIKEIKMQKFSPLKTIVFLGGTMGVLTLVALISLSTSNDNSDFSDITLPN